MTKSWPTKVNCPHYEHKSIQEVGQDRTEIVSIWYFYFFYRSKIQKQTERSAWPPMHHHCLITKEGHIYMNHVPNFLLLTSSKHKKMKLSQAKYGTRCRKTKCIMSHYKLKKGENYLMHMDWALSYRFLEFVSYTTPMYKSKRWWAFS